MNDLKYTSKRIIFFPPMVERKTINTCLSHLTTQYPNYYFAVITPTDLDKTHDNTETFSYTYDEKSGFYNFVKTLPTLKNHDFCVIYAPKAQPAPQLPERILLAALNAGIRKFGTLSDDFRTAPYQPFKELQSTTLLTFPGPVLPLSMGSHIRVFSLVHKLNKKGVGVDLLITNSNKSERESIKSALKTIAKNIYFYNDDRKKLTFIDKAKNTIEKYIRHRTGHKKPAPPRFSNRAYQKPTTSLKNKLNTILNNNHNYKNVIMSYAWLINGIDKIERRDVKYMCDMHDVNFIRNADLNKNEPRYLYDANSEKKLELDLLNKMDGLMAISESDTAFIETEIKDKPVFTVPSSAENLLRAITDIDLKQGINFGFIGKDMEANTLSLKIVIEEWLPTIRKYSPESKLFVAGDICDTNYLQEKAFFEDEIIALGRVDDLNDFYDRFDVMCSPMQVRGGLNYKSVEALLAGKILFTNELGTGCLGADMKEFCHVIEKADDLTNKLTFIETNLKQTTLTRQEAQSKAYQAFIDHQGYDALINFLEHGHSGTATNDLSDTDHANENMKKTA